MSASLRPKSIRELLDEIRRRAGRGGGASVLASGAASVISRIVQGAATFLVVSWALPYLGAERFGAWMTLAAAFGLLGVGDLGISNGVINLVANYRATARMSRARLTVNAATVTMALLAACIAIGALVAAPIIPWGALFAGANTSLRNMSPDEMASMALLLGLAFAVSLLTGLFTKIRLGCNEAYRNAPWDILAALVSMGLTFAAVRTGMGFLWVIAASALPPIVVHAVGGMFLFGREHRELAPCPPHLSADALGRALRFGGLYFALQLGGLLSHQIDSLVLARLIGPGAVSEYNVAMRLFMLVPNLVGMLLVPLWPAYAAARARGDWGWIRKAWWISLAFCMACNLAAAVSLWFLNAPILHLWIRDAVRPSSALIAGFAIWAILNGFHGPVAILLNGLSIIRFQVICGLLSACVNVVISILLTLRIGVSGVVWGSVAAHTLVVLMPSLWLIFRVFRNRPGGQVPA